MADQAHPESPEDVAARMAREEPGILMEAMKLLRGIAIFPLLPEILYILQWRDPIRTGLIFGIIQFAFYLTFFGGYTITTLYLYSVLSLLIISLVYANGVVIYSRYAGAPAGNPLTGRSNAAQYQIPPALAEKFLESFVVFYNSLLEVIRDVFFGEYPLLSLKVAALLYFLALWARMFSTPVLLYLWTLGIFIVPRFYFEKKQSMDTSLLLFSEVSRQASIFASRIPNPLALLGYGAPPGAPGGSDAHPPAPAPAPAPSSAPAPAHAAAPAAHAPAPTTTSTPSKFPGLKKVQ